MPPKVSTEEVAQFRDELDIDRGGVAGLQQLLRSVRGEVRELRASVQQVLGQSEVVSFGLWPFHHRVRDS